jgi:hypothetical protein
MTNRQIMAARLARGFMPRWWSFAYPVAGRSVPWARRWAMRAWLLAFRYHAAHRIDGQAP